jgi:centromere protein J
LTTNVDPPDRRHSAHLPQAQASWLASSSFRQHELQPDGTRVTVYPNGTRKELKADGSTILHFANGDIQTVDRRGSTAAYWFADTQVVRLSHHNPLTSPSDPCVLYQFPNGQVEFHYRDGRKFVQFPNNETRWVIS